MKTPSLLLSAAVVSLVFAGCAAHAIQARQDSRTLTATLAPDLERPPAGADDAGPWPANQTLVRAVAELDQRDVLRWLGRPSERITPEFWVYWHHHTGEDVARNGGHDTLVVTFVRGRVSGMKLVQGDVLRTRLAGGWRPPPALAQR